jgi:molecular chaperone DnaK (HSP70)
VSDAIIGIDFGTSSTRVSNWQDYRSNIITSRNGSRMISSCVSFDGHGLLVGDDAKGRAENNATRTTLSAIPKG